MRNFFKKKTFQNLNCLKIQKLKKFTRESRDLFTKIQTFCLNEYMILFPLPVHSLLLSLSQSFVVNDSTFSYHSLIMRSISSASLYISSLAFSYIIQYLKIACILIKELVIDTSSTKLCVLPWAWNMLHIVISHVFNS